MQSSALNKQRSNSDVRTGTCASLSVVVVSSGSALVAQRATQALKTAAEGLPAQLIVVSQDNDPAFAHGVECTGAVFVVAPAGCSRAEMCDLGMNRATGTIVAVRDDAAVGDASWLNAYKSVLPKNVPAPVQTELVIMDTMIAGRVGRADNAVSTGATESTVRGASIEMSAAI
jgi:hypothetical protein